MYLFKDRLLNGVAQAVGASAVSVVSNVIPISREDAIRFTCEIWCSAITRTTGITFKLQDSLDGVYWEDVGSSGAVSVAAAKTATGGTAGVDTAQFATTAGAAQGDYVVVSNQAGTKYAIWLDIDAAGTVPTGAAYVAADVKIKVPIITGSNGTVNATAAMTAIGSLLTDITPTRSTDTITFTQLKGGVSTAIARHNTGDTGNGSFTIANSTPGAAGGTVPSTDRITVTGHGWNNGQAFLYSAGTTAIGGLTTGTLYYAIVIDANTIKAATSAANALAGTAVDLTDSGTGTQSFLLPYVTIKMIVDDSTAEVQLPLLPLARVVCTTGSGDAVTVSNVWFSRRDGH